MSRVLRGGSLRSALRPTTFPLLNPSMRLRSVDALRMGHVTVTSATRQAGQKQSRFRAITEAMEHTFGVTIEARRVEAELKLQPTSPASARLFGDPCVVAARPFS